MKAVVRRAELPAQVEKAPIKVDDRLSIDFNRREVIVEGKPIKLRPTEWRLLFHLVQNAGWVVPHESLLSKVWGWEYRDETQYLRLYITYLRQKIEKIWRTPNTSLPSAAWVIGSVTSKKTDRRGSKGSSRIALVRIVRTKLFAHRSPCQVTSEAHYEVTDVSRARHHQA